MGGYHQCGKPKKAAIALKEKVAKPKVVKAKAVIGREEAPAAKATDPRKTPKALNIANTNNVPIEIKAKKVRGQTRSRAQVVLQSLVKIQKSV